MIVHLDITEKKCIQELIKKLASEERIGIDEHIYKDNRAYDRWDINPFQLFEFMKQILNNPEIKEKRCIKLRISQQDTFAIQN
jgi:hypothetical protein